MKPQMTWYFDFISPYAWLQSRQLSALAAVAEVTVKPILFAGLLKHWGQLGPAEIVPKRQWTFEQIAWLAHQNAAPLKAPPAHPFNPLPLLRACIAAGSTIESVQKIYAFVWEQGHAVEHRDAFDQLLSDLKIDRADLDNPTIKQALLDNTNQAIESNVFGVPTAVLTTDHLQQQRFWGFDSTAMVLSAIKGDPFWTSKEFAGAASFPQGQGRKQIQK